MRRVVAMDGEEFTVEAGCDDVSLSISGVYGYTYATPEQALEAANALVEAALEIINARPQQPAVQA